MRYVSSILLLAVTACGLHAAPPKVPGPIKAKVGEIVEVEITEDAAGKIGYHNPYDVTSLFVRDAVPRREKTVSLLIQPKEGMVYRIAVWTAGETTGATLLIDASDGQVDPKPVPPDPKPEPKPDPKPNPVVTDPWLIVIEESSLRTLESIKVLNDITFWKSVPSNVGWRIYDKDSPDVKKYKYDVMAGNSGIPLPVMLLVDGKGNLVKAEALPKTTAEVREFIRKNAGY